MSTYRKKPVEVQAIQLTWHNWNALCDMIGEFPEGMRGVFVNPQTGEYSSKSWPMSYSEIGLLIPTLEGTMLARENDYVIKGIAGEFYPCKPDIFAESYDLIAE